jgi:hypothetical protein
VRLGGESAADAARLGGEPVKVRACVGGCVSVVSMLMCACVCVCVRLGGEHAKVCACVRESERDEPCSDGCMCARGC